MESPRLSYAPVWSKYRPAILKMMLDAAQTPQQYKMTELEFKAIDAKKRSGFSFNVTIAQSKAVNNIKDSDVAKDLLSMLSQSRKGSELIQLNTYEMSLDKYFVLHIQQVETIK